MVKAGDHWSLRMSCEEQDKGTRVLFRVRPNPWPSRQLSETPACFRTLFVAVIYLQNDKSSPETYAKLIAHVVGGNTTLTALTKQIAPVLDEILGCQILVTNFIFGGSKGYELGMMMSILKTPPS